LESAKGALKPAKIPNGQSLARQNGMIRLLLTSITFSALSATAIFAIGMAPLLAQTTAKDDLKGAKEEVKEAGKATGRAAKKTGRAVKKTSKKAVNKAAEKTEEGADAVRRKTNP